MIYPQEWSGGKFYICSEMEERDDLVKQGEIVYMESEFQFMQNNEDLCGQAMQSALYQLKSMFPATMIVDVRPEQ